MKILLLLLTVAHLFFADEAKAEACLWDPQSYTLDGSGNSTHNLTKIPACPVGGTNCGATPFYSNRPSVNRFKAYMSHLPNNIDHRNCAGGVRNVRFENNFMDLHSIGFYGAAFARKAQGNFVIDPSNWYEQGLLVSSRNSNYLLSGNTFWLNADCTTEQCHSGIKVQSIGKIRIVRNVFDTTRSSYAFGSGGAINLAYSMFDSVIRNNKISFPLGHRYPWQGISVIAAFHRHVWYGVGSIAAYYDVVNDNWGLGIPASGVMIEQNEFTNTGIRMGDVCHPGLGAFCQHLDANQSDGARPNEIYYVTGNQFTLPVCGARTPKINLAYCQQDGPIDFISRSESPNSWAADNNCPAPGPQDTWNVAETCDPAQENLRFNLKQRVFVSP